jgi:hypothetical protein
MIRPTDELFDPRIADWLEADPTRAPLELLDGVLAGMPAVQQRPRYRLAWAAQRRVMTPLAFVAGVAFAVVASLVLIGRPATHEIAGPSNPPPTTLPSPSTASSAALPSALAAAPSAPPDLGIVPSLTKRFTSPTYGYSVAIRPDWVTKPATLAWSGPDNSPPVVDTIDFTGTESGMTVGSEALAAGQTFEDWLVSFTVRGDDLSAFCQANDPSLWPPVQVGDAVGRWQQMCNAAEVVVESGGRVYVFTWGSSTFDTSKELSADDYKAVLTTVRFDPAAVPPSPTPPPLRQSFTSPRMGYSLELPAGWSVNPATRPWAPRTQTSYTDGTLDVFQSKTARLAITSQLLTAGQTAEDWMLQYCLMYQPGWVDCPKFLPTWPAVSIGGVTGRIDMEGIAASDTIVDGGRIFDAVVVNGDRAYGISLDGLVDRTLFDALVSSMTLTPETAVDASPSPT